jgi:hypothetical protein
MIGVTPIEYFFICLTILVGAPLLAWLISYLLDLWMERSCRGLGFKGFEEKKKPPTRPIWSEF